MFTTNCWSRKISQIHSLCKISHSHYTLRACIANWVNRSHIDSLVMTQDSLVIRLKQPFGVIDFHSKTFSEVSKLPCLEWNILSYIYLPVFLASRHLRALNFRTIGWTDSFCHIFLDTKNYIREYQNMQLIGWFQETFRGVGARFYLSL